MPATRLSKDERVEQLLDVAQRLFARNGFDSTSIEQLAKAAGITRPIVYEHFGSKEGIYLACIRRARSLLDEALAEAVDGIDDLEQRLAAGIDASFAFIEADPERWAVLFNGVAIRGDVAEEAMRLRFATIERIADLIHDANPRLPRREVEAYAHSLSGAGEQLERWWQRNPKVPRSEVVGYLQRFAWQGLQALVPTSGARGRR